ncbi:hypothetical protein ACN4EK_16225 [Pantanalinema rosaneae CENA516]|uniref:hypothetical protein n=1 Tax=Pantanalinema rosaneae TaxID=1620701 RepID=UPI003D6EE0A9
MSQTLTLELSDPVFTAIRQQAENMGISPERLATELLEQKFFQAVGLLTGEAEKKIARSNFERHFGTLEPDCFVDVDNESIDTDLALEYAERHEDG